MSDKPTLLSEDLDGVAFSKRDHSLLPGTSRANVITHALGLGLNVKSVHLNDRYIEDLFD